MTQDKNSTGEPGRWPPPALRISTFRWYWLGQWPTLLGIWMQMVALGLLVYTQTHNVGAVALVAAANGIAATITSLLGGVLADRHPRRSILICTQSALGLTACLFALLIALGLASFPVILVVAGILGVFTGVDVPSQQALVTDLVDRQLVVNAMALTGAATNVCRMVGPAVAGLLYAVAGPGACFGFMGITYLTPILVLGLVVPRIEPVHRSDKGRALPEFWQVLKGALSDPQFRLVLLLAAVLQLLGSSYLPFLPVLAVARLHGGSSILGLMYSAGGVGGLAGAFLLAGLGSLDGGWQRRFVVGGGILFSLSLLTVSQSTQLFYTLPALVGISMGFLLMNTTLITILQTSGHPAIRGRLLGLYATVMVGFPPLGTLLYGSLGLAHLFVGIGLGAIVIGVCSVLVARSRTFLRVPMGEAGLPARLAQGGERLSASALLGP